MVDDLLTLRALPEGFGRTRDRLHRLALHVVYLTRREATGRYGLVWTPGGFGTPVFADGEQVRVAGSSLVHQSAGSTRSTPITSLRAAAEFLDRQIEPDFDHGFGDVVAAGDVDADLGIDEAAADALGDFYGFSDEVLRAVRSDVRREDGQTSEITLWPEHFDIALDTTFGAPADEQRVNVGGSPGDAGHPTPYLYVGPWTADRPGDADYWNADFGAILGQDEIVAAGDAVAQRDRALDFVRTGLSWLRSM